jgi:hypothetical protein
MKWLLPSRLQTEAWYSTFCICVLHVHVPPLMSETKFHTHTETQAKL